MTVIVPKWAGKHTVILVLTDFTDCAIFYVMPNASPAYESLQDYMAQTGTSQRELAKRAGIGETHLSLILKTSRRCSMATALKLKAVTGVPVENLVQWPKVRTPRNFRSVA